MNPDFKIAIDTLETKNKVLVSSYRKIVAKEKSKLSGNYARSVHINVLNQDFRKAWIDYNEVMMDYQNSVKNLLIKQCIIIGNDGRTEDGIIAAIEQGKSPLLFLHETQIAKQQLNEISVRHQELEEVWTRENADLKVDFKSSYFSA